MPRKGYVSVTIAKEIDDVVTALAEKQGGRSKCSIIEEAIKFYIQQHPTA